MKFAFIAKHRGIWPAAWLCGALGVSRGGFYAWFKRPRSRRLAKDWENLNRKALAFLRFASIRLMLRKLRNPD